MTDNTKYPGVIDSGDGPVGWDLIPRGKKVSNGKLVNKTEEQSTPKVTMKRSELKEMIKQVVRVRLDEMTKKKVNEAGLTSEKGDKWLQKAINPAHKGICTPITKSTCTGHAKALAKTLKKHHGFQKEQVGADVVAEKAPPGFGPGKAHADIYNKLMTQYKGDPSKAYATMWSIHNKMNEVAEGMMNEAEASYKVVSPTQAQVQKDNQAFNVQIDPKVNETAYKVQGPSAKTFKDSPQLPKAQNDPRNA